MKRVNISLSDDVLALCDRCADAMGLNRSSMITVAIWEQYQHLIDSGLLADDQDAEDVENYIV